MKTLIAVAWWIVLLTAPAFAETAPVELLKGRTVEQWITRLASDVYKEREEATLVLSLGGKGVEPALKKAAESPDTEVRTRAKLALSAQELKSLVGEFVCVESLNTSEDGTVTVEPPDATPAIIRVKKGHVVFIQEYGGSIEQLYTFPEETPLEFRQKCAIKMKWISISDSNVSYFPDKNDPKLEAINSEHGVRLVLSATDTNGTLLKKIFVPKPVPKSGPNGGKFQRNNKPNPNARDWDVEVDL